MNSCNGGRGYYMVSASHLDHHIFIILIMLIIIGLRWVGSGSPAGGWLFSYWVHLHGSQEGKVMIMIMVMMVIMSLMVMMVPTTRFNKRGEPLEMPGHSIPLAGLGGFILIFGFLAFNGGSQVHRRDWGQNHP